MDVRIGVEDRIVLLQAIGDCVILAMDDRFQQLTDLAKPHRAHGVRFDVACQERFEVATSDRNEPAPLVLVRPRLGVLGRLRDVFGNRIRDGCVEPGLLVAWEIFARRAHKTREIDPPALLFFHEFQPRFQTFHAAHQKREHVLLLVGPL